LILAAVALHPLVLLLTIQMQLSSGASVTKFANQKVLEILKVFNQGKQ
jgi:hypothetical protein